MMTGAVVSVRSWWEVVPERPECRSTVSPWDRWFGSRLFSAAVLRSHLVFLSALAFMVQAFAQQTLPVNGPHHTARPVYALVGATLHPEPGVTINSGVLLVQDDRITAVVGRGSDNPPPGAIVLDMTGFHIWPSFVEPWSNVGIPVDKDRKSQPGVPNRAVRATTNAASLYLPDADQSANQRALGFGAALVHRTDGIVRGTGAVVAFSDRSPLLDVLRPSASTHFSFRKGTSPDGYPSSLTGSIALLRQTLYNAQWYIGEGAKELRDVELEAINSQLPLPAFFEASERNDVLRIYRIAKEFERTFIVKGKGDEYARAADIAATKLSLIIPLSLPEAFDVEDPFAALEVQLAQLKHWELAQRNAAILHHAGVPFAFTAQGIKDREVLMGNLRRMLMAGLDTTAALAALTTVPAGMIGMAKELGRLAPGLIASFQITHGYLFSKEAVLHEHWVAGKRFVLKPHDAPDLRGAYAISVGEKRLRMNVKGEPGKLEVRIGGTLDDSAMTKVDARVNGSVITLVFDGKNMGFPGSVRLNGAVHRESRIWDGTGQLPDGTWISWSAMREGSPDKPTQNKRNGAELDSLYALFTGDVWFPAMGSGVVQLPDTETVLLHGANVWTNTARGILRNTDVCLHNGKVLAVGEGLDKSTLFPKAKVIVREVDARGKHLTCGIIDEHSHIAIARGVNEGGQANTAEVRMGDVVDPDDIDIYRNLAGGVTAAQLLHGSANPLGGQSALIKMRWGLNAERMKIDGAPGFIKFALGENVKQSNWENDRRRYPQSRMGVEQIMSDGFHRARAYDQEWNSWRALLRPAPKRKKSAPAPARPSPRRDLELDAMAEILNGQRFITCHSYVQSEISMLMGLADSMGFKVNTFTHILEGYKVADRMKEHGVSASSFSDWWAYKFEVYDAIPYNGALLWHRGVNVGFNSDDAEMSRRLNQEAAKAVKYGGVTEEEAWKFVTLNPAKMLHLDHRMGKVEPGMDADIVLWSANPLSIDARCEMTFVDGVCRFDLAKDAERRKTMAAERQRIINLMIAAKKAGAPTRKTERKEQGHWHCETMGEEP